LRWINLILSSRKKEIDSILYSIFPQSLILEFLLNRIYKYRLYKGEKSSGKRSKTYAMLLEVYSHMSHISNIKLLCKKRIHKNKIKKNKIVTQAIRGIIKIEK